MKRFWKAGVVLVALIVLVGAAAGFVSAQTAGDGPPAPGERPNFLARLAENLGISQEELQAAVRQTQLDLVDEALAAGRISEERAAEIRERIESGEGRLFPHRAHRAPCRGAYVAREVAELFGVTPQELLEMWQGQTLAQVAEANGVSVDGLTAFLMGEVEERAANALAEGKIDQAQADAILARASERIDQLINHEGPPPCHRSQRPAPAGDRPGGF